MGACWPKFCSERGCSYLLAVLRIFVPMPCFALRLTGCRAAQANSPPDSGDRGSSVQSSVVTIPCQRFA